MWIMLVTFLHYAVVGHFSPALESVEFTSKENCEHARTAYLAELAPLAAQLNDAIKQELKTRPNEAPQRGYHFRHLRRQVRGIAQSAVVLYWRSSLL